MTEMTMAEARCIKAQHRRDARRAEGVCINSGPLSRVKHGPVLRGGKCRRCIKQHRRSA